MWSPRKGNPLFTTLPAQWEQDRADAFNQRSLGTDPRKVSPQKGAAQISV